MQNSKKCFEGCPDTFGQTGLEYFKFDQKLPLQGAPTGCPHRCPHRCPDTFGQTGLEKIAIFRAVFS
jgi:hypothetical protein